MLDLLLAQVVNALASYLQCMDFLTAELLLTFPLIKVTGDILQGSLESPASWSLQISARLEASRPLDGALPASQTGASACL